MTQTKAPATRREQQREEMFAEIVSAARAILADEDSELSLRAVAQRMGLTAPALYRYIASYQELIDLVAYEIDQSAVGLIREAVATVPADDPAARLMLGVTAFRQWALGHRAEFALMFGNPITDYPSSRRELYTSHGSCLQLTNLVFELWEATRFDIPTVDELPAAAHEVLADPLIPADVEQIPDDARGLVWVYMQGWTALFGIVALESMGHMDPRLIENGELYLDVMRRLAPVVGLADDADRLVTLMRERIRSQAAQA